MSRKSRPAQIQLFDSQSPRLPHRIGRFALVWLDVLGFGRLLRSAQAREPRAFATIGRLDRLLSRVASSAFIQLRHSVVLFSDTILIKVPLSAATLEQIAYELPFQVGDLQAEFVMSGLPVRGAITFGRLLSGGNISASSAFGALYGYESSQSRVPRILMATDMSLDGFDEDLSIFAEHIHAWETAGLPGFDALMPFREDADGHLYIDYLISHLRYENWVALRRHKQVIEEAVLAHGDRPDVLGKYLWIAEYHNLSLSEWFEEEMGCSIADVEGEDGALLVDMSIFPNSARNPITADSASQSDC